MKSHISSAEVTDMFYEQGMSTLDIAAYFECTPQTVMNRIKQFTGSFIRKPQASGKRYPRIEVDEEGEYEDPQLIADIVRMYYVEKVNYYDIHKKVGYKLDDVITVVLQEYYKDKPIVFESPPKRLPMVKYDICEVCGVSKPLNKNKTCGRKCAILLREESTFMSEYEKAKALKEMSLTNI